MTIKILVKNYSFYVLLFFILSLLAYQKYATHQNGWRSELWADQGGYYVLLPSVFIYDLDAKKLPKDIQNTTGNGFSIDTVRNKINTRYTYGVALLQAPFFLFIHYCTHLPEEVRTGFSDPYYQVPNFASLFYSFTGIILLIQFLKRYFSPALSIATTSCMFFGTNLFYYSTDTTGMSHIYSFFLFAAFLYLTGKLIDATKNKKLFFLFWSVTFSVLLLARPINFIIILIPIFLDCRSKKDLLFRIKEFTHWNYILLFVLTVCVLFLPQFLYWNYLTGKWVYYSYGNESFSNWNHPQFIEVLFSPNNGLFLYNPLYLVIIGGMIYMVLKKINNGILFSGIFLLFLYIAGAWFSFSLGCGFGHRGLAEYSAVFALPMGYVLSWIYWTRNKTRLVLAFLIFTCVLFNLKLIFSFDKCFIGSTWEYKEYGRLILRGAYYKKINFGNTDMNPDKEFSERIYLTQNSYTASSFRRAIVKGAVEFYNPNSRAELVFMIAKNNKTIYWASFTLTNKEQNISKILDLPRPSFDLDAEISVCIWNKEKKFLKLEKLELLLK